MLALVDSEKVVCHENEYRWLTEVCRHVGVYPPGRRCTRSALLATLSCISGARAQVWRERLGEEPDGESG